jgi:methylglutaconyl-CoA hydratase
MGFGKVINAMRKAAQPVIVRVQGKAVGGGVGLIAGADLALANVNASVKLSELSIGIGPYVIAPAIIRKTGRSFFQRMAFQPWRWFTAFQAHEAGLFDSVSENEKNMDEMLEHICSAYEKYDAEAIRMLKKEARNDTENWDELLARQARKSASLLLREPVKELLRSLKTK